LKYNEYMDFLTELDLSVRSLRGLARAYEPYADWEESKLMSKEEKNAIRAIQDVETYEDLSDAVQKHLYRNIGRKSVKEIVQKCGEMAKKDQDKRGMKSISKSVPIAGVPLMVKTKDESGRISVKYPVYYAKDPYSLEWRFWFFPALESPCALIKEYSEVIEWCEITGEIA